MTVIKRIGIHKAKAGPLLMLTSSVVLVPTVALGDQEAFNEPIVVVSPGGRCYAKSVPEASFGDSGKTTLFRVTETLDTALNTFDWYANDIHLICDVFIGESEHRSTVVVRFGPWARGGAASADHLALAMYVDGQELARFSTLDIAGTPDNVDWSISHYEVFTNQRCFGEDANGTFGFFARRFDDQVIFFDGTSGEMRLVHDCPC